MKSLLQFLRQLQFWLCSGQMHYIHGADTLPPPLSAPEERAMLEALANGNTDAREQLIVHNLRLVVYIAKKFESTGIGLEDLISIGTIGLIKAVNTFCPTKKIKLATYASRCIENEILMFLRKATQYRGEVSIDEPLNIDWDGNELLLSDILGTDADVVSRNIEQESERELLRSAVSELGTREREIMGVTVRAGGWKRKDTERSRSGNWNFAILYLPSGKENYPKTQRHITTIQPITKKTAAHRFDVQRSFLCVLFYFLFKEGKTVMHLIIAASDSVTGFVKSLFSLLNLVCQDPNLLRGTARISSAL